MQSRPRTNLPWVDSQVPKSNAAKAAVVDGNTNAQYVYDALNQRVRITGSGDPNEFIFNAAGQRSLTFDPVNNNQYGKAYWGASPVSYYYSDGQTHFEYQDWQGTERMRTYWDGSVEATYQSLPWGDGFSASGADDDPYHFAGLDQDASSLDHAQSREYFNTSGGWMSPDPYGGSYDFSNPQSFNRYSYVNGMPLSFTDPSGQFGNPAESTRTDPHCGWGCWTELGAVLGAQVAAIALIADLMIGPQFKGSLKPRPSTGDPNWDGNFGESLGISTKIPTPSWGIATALGLPDAGCEFGVCGSVVFDATDGQGGWEIDKRPLSGLGALGNDALLFHYYFYNTKTHQSVGLGPGKGAGLFCKRPGKWEASEKQGTLFETIPGSMQSCVDNTLQNDLKKKPSDYFFWDSYGSSSGTNCMGYAMSVVQRCAP